MKTFQVCFVYWPIFHPICIKIVLGLSQGVVTIYININHPPGELSSEQSTPTPPIIARLIALLTPRPRQRLPISLGLPVLTVSIIGEVEALKC